MALKAVIFGTDETLKKMKPYYDKAIQNEFFELLSYALFKDDGTFVYGDGNLKGGDIILKTLTLR